MRVEQNDELCLILQQHNCCWRQAGRNDQALQVAEL